MNLFALNLLSVNLGQHFSRRNRGLTSTSVGSVSLGVLLNSVLLGSAVIGVSSLSVYPVSSMAAPAAAMPRPRLTGLQLESDPEGGNMVVADVKSAAAFKLKRTAPSEYVLTIKGAALDPTVSATLLAEPNSGSIRSVRPVTQGDDVILRVFVAPEASITARTQGGKIMLGQFGGASQNEESMAQIAPEAAKKDAKPAPVVTAKDAADKGKPASAKEVPSKENPKAADTTDRSPIEDKFAALLSDDSKYTGRLISLDLQDTDIDNALRIIAEVSNLNIIASEDVTGKITLRLIDVPWDQALDVILKTNGLDKVQEGNVVRIAPVEKLRQEREQLKQAIVAEQELEPLSVEYIRVSYARSADLKPLVESVLTERGSVAFDERTNQLIVKDIKLGIRNVAKLIAKLDLRTPQILLETQIVEASRSLLRDLGSELDFNFVMSPATGNATGYNFPNSVSIGGGKATGGNVAEFPAAVTATSGSSMALALGSADGTKSLTAVISALETEGRARIVSRPAVATTNNKAATIKAVEKIRVKLPSGGLSVATGANASANGGGSAATETIEIGITLDVTPQASPDYYVLLDIRAKSSTLGDKTVDGIPSERERSATSTVLVSSGQTFAMGGIYKITDRDTVDGVPFFKDIPVLGAFFRRSKVDNSDEELLFFITPRIIEGSFDDAAMRAAAS